MITVIEAKPGARMSRPSVQWFVHCAFRGMYVSHRASSYAEAQQLARVLRQHADDVFVGPETFQ